MSARRTARTRMTAVAVVGVAAAMVLVACSSSTSSPSSTSAAASAPAASSAAPASAAPSSSAAAASSAAASAPADDAKDIGVIDPAALPMTIPFTDKQSHIVVDAGFGSDKSYSMMFDTGAPVKMTDEIAKENRLQVVGETQGVAGGGALLKTPVVAIPKMTVGDLAIAQVLGTTPWVDADNPLSCVTESGLVGPKAMNNGVWQIDYQNKTITVTPSLDGVEHVDGAIKLPFTEDGGINGSPYVTLPVGSGELKFLVDTGSPFGILAGPKELASVGADPAADAPVVKQQLVGAGGTTDFTVPYVTTTVDLAGTKFDYPIAALDAIPGVGNIGNAFLNQFVVTFDFPNKTMYLDPISADGTVANPPVAAASLGWDGKNAIVASVAQGSEAAKAGLKLGDKVTEADGSPITTRDEFCATTNNPDLKSITTPAGTFNAGPVTDFFPAK